jgi:hypothetical protein
MKLFWSPERNRKMTLVMMIDLSKHNIREWAEKRTVTTRHKKRFGSRRYPKRLLLLLLVNMKAPLAVLGPKNKKC